MLQGHCLNACQCSLLQPIQLLLLPKHAQCGQLKVTSITPLPQTSSFSQIDSQSFIFPNSHPNAQAPCQLTCRPTAAAPSLHKPAKQPQGRLQVLDPHPPPLLVTPSHQNATPSCRSVKAAVTSRCQAESCHALKTSTQHTCQHKHHVRPFTWPPNPRTHSPTPGADAECGF
jgi:hypothetical protein